MKMFRGTKTDEVTFLPLQLAEFLDHRGTEILLISRTGNLEHELVVCLADFIQNVPHIPVLLERVTSAKIFLRKKQTSKRQI